MNNILFATNIITEGDFFDNSEQGSIGFYDLDTLALTDNVSGKDFGILNQTPLTNISVINIPDIHVLNVVSSELPSNNRNSISIGAGSDIDETDTSDVELIILHNNVAPNGTWRQFITIPYNEFNGDTSTLLSIIFNKISTLFKNGNLDGTNGVRFSSNTVSILIDPVEQYNVITKSSYLSITGPIAYLPVYAAIKCKEIIDKNTASWGIWNREEDDSWLPTVIDEFNQLINVDTIISIRYVTSRKASVTHDEPIYNTLHIITSTSTGRNIMAMFEPSESSEQTP